MCKILSYIDISIRTQMKQRENSKIRKGKMKKKKKTHRKTFQQTAFANTRVSNHDNFEQKVTEK